MKCLEVFPRMHCTPWLLKKINTKHTSADTMVLNSSLPGQNGHDFADYIFRFIFNIEKFYIFMKISLQFVPKAPIYNNPALD